MNRVVHFEIHAPDPDAAQRFYHAVFGWSFTAWQGDEEYWLVSTGEGEGINGGLMRSRDGQGRTVNAIQVESVDQCVRRVEANGGTIVVPKMPIPGVGWVAYAIDPGGVIFGMYQHDPSAA